MVFQVTAINSLQGCTATVLLVWTDGDDNIFAQCANVGDSACVVKYVLSCHPFMRTIINITYHCERSKRIPLWISLTDHFVWVSYLNGNIISF